MNITFDNQDVTDAVCVLVAARENFGTVNGSNPEMVDDIRLFFHPSQGFSAEAALFGENHFLNEQDLIEGVALYLSAYHSFIPDCILVNLQYHSDIDEFGAEIIIER